MANNIIIDNNLIILSLCIKNVHTDFVNCIVYF